MSIINSRYGKFKVLDGDAVISRSLKLYGEWAQHEIDLIVHFIRPGSLVVDVGAFIGTHARAFSTFVGESGKVIAFEPRHDAVAILIENAKLAPINNISVINSALGAADRRLTVAIPHADSNANYGALTLDALICQDDCGEEITVTTLDEYRLERLDFVKIDVEGMELAVLNGAINTLERCRPVIFAESNSLESSVPIIKWCQEKNYQIYGVLSAAYNQDNYAEYAENIFGAAQEVGIFLIPSETIFQHKEALLKLRLPQINTADDLALLLLHKPQYPFEVFAHTKVAEILTLAYPSPQAETLNQILVDRDGQIASLNQSMTERDGQIASLNHAVAERDGQIASLNQSMTERDGQIASLNHAVSEYEGRIIAYHNVVMGRDETINALSNLVAERDRIIQETYRSHSWRLTKPIRFLSRTVRKVLNFSLKFKPSKIKFVYNLATPHLKTVIRNPGRLKSKLHFFNIAWQSGGYRGVIQQLQQTSTSNSAINRPSNEISVIEVMQQLARIPHALEPTDLPFYSVAETASHYRRDTRPVVLFISHTYGGGTEKHISELADALSTNNARVLMLRPANGENGCDVALEAFNVSERLKVGLSSQNIELLAGVIKAFGVSKVHVHHTIGFGFSIEELLIAIGLPYDVTIHDYYSICPLINLRTTNKGYCGSPTTDDCNACLALEPARAGGIEITWWRAKYASLLNGANAVYCPSRDTASRIAEHYPAAPLQVVLHEDIDLPRVRFAAEARATRRIAILGVLASHKGLGLIEDALAVIEKDELPIEFVLIGYPERTILGSKALTQTGPYNDGELPALIEEIDPDAILFPVQWPETYSYTLTTAILTGRPIVVANLGSLPERVKDISNAFVYPFEYTAVELVRYLLTLDLSRDGEDGKGGRVVSHG